MKILLHPIAQSATTSIEFPAECADTRPFINHDETTDQTFSSVTLNKQDLADLLKMGCERVRSVLEALHAHCVIPKTPSILENMLIHHHDRKSGRVVGVLAARDWFSEQDKIPHKYLRSFVVVVRFSLYRTKVKGYPDREEMEGRETLAIVPGCVQAELIWRQAIKDTFEVRALRTLKLPKRRVARWCKMIQAEGEAKFKKPGF